MTPARDPIEIARTIKLLREMHNMKATTLAEFSGLTLRSIERAESGRHRLSEQALQQIAQAFKVSVTVFDPFDLVDPVTLRKAYENSAKKMVLVPAVPFKNTAEVMGMIGETVGYWHDLSSIQDDAALDAATEFMQAFIDTKDLWDTVPVPEQLKLVRELVAWAEELLALGYKTQMGNCRVQHRGGKKRRFTLNLITFLPKDHPGGNTQGCSCQIIWRLGRKIAPSCRPISAQ